MLRSLRFARASRLCFSLGARSAATFDGARPPSESVAYEEVDAENKTKLDRLYAEQQRKTRQILTTPVSLPPDGSYRPDFLIGLKEYSFRIRDEYRNVISQRLGVPLNCVKLSTGWSEKLDIRYMRDTKTVLGVTLLKPTDDIAVRPKEPMDDTPEKKALIESFVAAVNKREDDQLMRLSVVRAALARPEVGAPTEEYQPQFADAAEKLRSVTEKLAVVILTDGTCERCKSKVSLWTPVFYQRHVIPKVIDIGPPAKSDADVTAAQVTLEGANENGGAPAVVVPRFWLSRVLLSQSGVAPSHAPSARTDVDAQLPAVFFNGVYIGADRQLDYLLSNTTALDAILLRPHKIHVEHKGVV